ncbi:MAG: hypothetical protein FJ220_07595 [Kiritimatiellaceae bacterium]|nr:hypothetical protein [Kiritimatiellaceae bacterium]
MNRYREKFEYALLCTLTGLLKPLPVRLIERFFHLLGTLFFTLNRRRRIITLRNLALAFPEKTPDERRAIAKQTFINIAEFIGDSFLLMANKFSSEEICSMVDGSQLDSKYRVHRAASSNGALHITGHLGNWELMAHYAALQGLNSHVIARKGNNILIEERIITPLRTRYGNKIFYKDNAMLNTIKALKRNEAVSFLIDQKIGSKEGVQVQLFGHTANAVASCAVIQMRFNPLVIPVFMVKNARRRYQVIVGDPITWQDDGSPKEEQIQKLTQRHQQVIEDMVRKYPDQWFWMHNRWKLK